MSIATPSTDLESTLRQRFGLEHFRPGQREVIENVLGGRDVLCVMPTGGGKSLCYQLPALLLSGITLVVSPLIALMKDQVDTLVGRGVRATLLNSTLDPAEQRARILEIEAGQYDLVYVAPERFRSGRFVEMIAKARPSLLAIDEAHCISEWGHDFRPDYARIGHARRQIGSPPCIALTATATDVVRRDIAELLELRDPAQFVTGFDRPNLSYHVIEARKDNDKLAALAETLREAPGSSIIYASSRARCESIAQHVHQNLKTKAVIYHAGLTREERADAQDRFMGGEVDVVVATNAFGMGVDKSDIRSVIHFNLPGTLEAYYQEAGRAGRDGLPARCVLLFAAGDRYLQEMFIENEYPSADAIYRVYEYLRGIDADPIELTHAEIQASSRVTVNESAVGTCLKILEGAGAVERFRPRENMAIVRIRAVEGDDTPLINRVGAKATTQQLVVRGIEGLVNRRFDEPVYFHPDDFAARLGLDRSALIRAIKALTHELPIDYIPPFRGNAVRVNNRSLKPRDIVIDFPTLEQRKNREYDKLERMLKYAQTKKCRRSVILSYFGDSESDYCGQCDNCEPGQARVVEPGRTVDTEAGREVLLKALSGVARSKGRFGKNLVAQMLTGSSSEKVTKLGLAKLSTFGILGSFRQTEVVEILDALATADLLEFDEADRFRPLLQITSDGLNLCKQPEGAWPTLVLSDELFAKVQNGGLSRISSRQASPPSLRDATASTAEEAEIVSPDLSGDPLYAHLKSLRATWAKEVNQSAFTIFPNQVLEALATQRPATPQELAGIKGMGSYRIERYGAAILAAIAGNEPAPIAHAPVLEQKVSPAELPTPIATVTPSVTKAYVPHRGVDLAAARSRVRPRRDLRDSWPRTADHRPARDLGRSPGEANSDRGFPPGRDPRRLGRAAVEGRDSSRRRIRSRPLGLVSDDSRGTRMTEPSEPPVHTMHCMEIRGGNKAVEHSVAMPGLDLWIYSQPYHAQAQGATFIMCRSAGAGSSLA